MLTYVKVKIEIRTCKNFRLEGHMMQCDYHCPAILCLNSSYLNLPHSANDSVDVESFDRKIGCFLFAVMFILFYCLLLLRGFCYCCFKDHFLTFFFWVRLGFCRTNVQRHKYFQTVF